MSVEIDVAQHIAAEVAGLTYNGNCRYGPPEEPDSDQTITGAIPGQCVFVQATGGPRMVIYRGGEPSADAPWPAGDREPTVQVWVRSARNAYTAGRALVDLIHSTLQANPPNGYFDMTAIDEPAFIRKTETDHYEWAINFRLKKHHATA